jgi:hypothetical protein
MRRDRRQHQTASRLVTESAGERLNSPASSEQAIGSSGGIADCS